MIKFLNFIGTHIIKYLFFDEKVFVIIDIYLHSLALQSIFYTIAEHDAFILFNDYVNLKQFYIFIFVKLSIAMIAITAYRADYHYIKNKTEDFFNNILQCQSNHLFHK